MKPVDDVHTTNRSMEVEIMRSNNTGSYESQERNFRYTMLAVLGALIVVGVLAFTMRDRINQAPGTQDPINVGPVSQGNQMQDQEMNVSKPVPTEIPAVDSRDTTGGGALGLSEEGKGNSFTAPLDQGTTIKKHSPQTPVYSETLDQFTTHIGVDVEATKDSQVKSIDEGTVTRVYLDDKLGATIEIDHGKGYISRYSNLSTEATVEEGDVVHRGQVIGRVGDTALFETSDPSHLHFEVWKDGKAVDPEEVTSL